MNNKQTSKKKVNIALTILFWIYMVVLFRITVFRSDFSFQNLFQNGNVNLSLFTGYLPLIAQRNWFRFIYLFVGNIVWFVPFGAYLAYTEKVKNVWQIAGYGFLLSLCIECLQYVFGTGYSELDDLILNTLGAFVGAVAYYVVVRAILTVKKRK